MGKSTRLVLSAVFISETNEGFALNLELEVYTEKCGANLIMVNRLYRSDTHPT